MKSYLLITVFVALSPLVFSQNLKLSNFNFLVGSSYVRDSYRSFDYFRGYAKDPNSFGTDSIDMYQYSELTPSPESMHQTVWYKGETYSFLIGFSPKKVNRELNFGIQYSNVYHSSFKGSGSRYLPWDTLSVTNTNGDIDTLFSNLIVTDQKNFELQTNNLFLSFDYLFFSRSTEVRSYIGFGISAGFTTMERITNTGQPFISEILYNPTENESFINYNVLDYPSWFYDPKFNSVETFESKQIFYFKPYLPFGLRIPLSQKENFARDFALAARGCVGLETQLMKRNTLMIRPTIDLSFGITYSIHSRKNSVE